MFDGYQGKLIVRSALRLAPLVFVRPGELRHAKWEELDLKRTEWRYMVSKTQTEHIVPLAKQSIQILREIQPLTGKGIYVFPSERGTNRAMSDNALLAAMRRMGIGKEEVSIHGFRATARTILDEVLGFHPDFIEHQLAHTVRDPNGRAYNRTAHIKQRKKMMQRWADYLDELKNGDQKVETTPLDYELLYVDISDVDDITGITHKSEFTFERAPSRARRIVKDRDSIISTVRTYLKAIAYIHNPEDNLIVSTGFAVIRPVKINKKFTSWYLKSNVFVEHVMALSKGVSYSAINSFQLSSIEIYFPSELEQHSIIAFLDRETKKINTLIEKVKGPIKLLREYRSALISAAVTGKIDLREEVA